MGIAWLLCRRGRGGRVLLSVWGSVGGGGDAGVGVRPHHRRG